MTSSETMYRHTFRRAGSFLCLLFSLCFFVTLLFLMLRVSVFLLILGIHLSNDICIHLSSFFCQKYTNAQKGRERRAPFNVFKCTKCDSTVIFFSPSLASVGATMWLQEEERDEEEESERQIRISDGPSFTGFTHPMRVKEEARSFALSLSLPWSWEERMHEEIATWKSIEASQAGSKKASKILCDSLDSPSPGKLARTGIGGQSICRNGESGEEMCFERAGEIFYAVCACLYLRYISLARGEYKEEDEEKRKRREREKKRYTDDIHDITCVFIWSH